MDDLISRQAAINFKVSHGINEDGIIYVPYGEVNRYLEQLPSAQPRKGKDICDTAKGHCEFKCSVCGVEIGVVEGGDLDGGFFNYCPNCGAKMEVESDAEIH